jgi:hypothetical protein
MKISDNYTDIVVRVHDRLNFYLKWDIIVRHHDGLNFYLKWDIVVRHHERLTFVFEVGHSSKAP